MSCRTSPAQKIACTARHLVCTSVKETTRKQRETQKRREKATDPPSRRATKASELHSLVHLATTFFHNFSCEALETRSRGEKSPWRQAPALLDNLPGTVPFAITMIASTFDQCCAHVTDVYPFFVTGLVFRRETLILPSYFRNPKVSVRVTLIETWVACHTNVSPRVWKSSYAPNKKGKVA